MVDDEEQVYVEVMIAFDGLSVGDRAMVPISWFEVRRRLLKPLMKRRWIGEANGPGGDLPTED